MEAKAIARYIRISPFKVRQVADLVRNKDCKEALAMLKFTPKGAAKPIAKVIRSAMANAEHNYDMVEDNLYISRIYIDEGPTLKRYKPRAMGRADIIRKRTSHITVVVAEREV